MRQFWVPFLKEAVAVSSILILVGSAGLTACSGENSGTDDGSGLGGNTASMAVELTPQLVEIFSQDCAQCHTKASTGAPLVGDVSAWQEVLSKGLDATLDRTFNGYRGMPPAGRCYECSAEQMTQLIYFMSQGAY